MSILRRSPRTLRQIEARIDELVRKLVQLDHDIDACEKGGLIHSITDSELRELKRERERTTDLYLWNIAARQAIIQTLRGF